jgi:hypothetical protein
MDALRLAAEWIDGRLPMECPPYTSRKTWAECSEINCVGCWVSYFEAKAKGDAHE